MERNTTWLNLRLLFSVILPVVLLTGTANARGDMPLSEDRPMEDSPYGDDPLGKWIEQNGERLGLVEPTGAELSHRRSRQVPDPVTVLPMQPLPNIIDSKDEIEKLLTLHQESEALMTEDPVIQVAAAMKEMKFGSTCDRFANESGLGSWGRVVVDELRRGNADALLDGTGDLRRFCPRYDSLGFTEKTAVWLKIVASAVFLESTCNPKSVARGPYGKAVGIAQLRAGHEHKYAPGCNKNDAYNPLSSIKCMMSNINEQVKAKGRLFYEKTHFGVLRPQGDLIKGKRVKKYLVITRGLSELPFCSNMTMASRKNLPAYSSVRGSSNTTSGTAAGTSGPIQTSTRSATVR